MEIVSLSFRVADPLRRSIQRRRACTFCCSKRRLLGGEFSTRLSAKMTAITQVNHLTWHCYFHELNPVVSFTLNQLNFKIELCSEKSLHLQLKQVSHGK